MDPKGSRTELEFVRGHCVEGFSPKLHSFFQGCCGHERRCHFVVFWSLHLLFGIHLISRLFFPPFSAEEGDDWITPTEFRVAIVYLIEYANLFDAFSSIDGGGRGVTGSDDDRIDLEEFMRAGHALKVTNFVAFENAVGKEEALFKKINSDGGDKILFAELCKYAVEKEKKARTSLGKLLCIGDEDNAQGARAKAKSKAK